MKRVLLVLFGLLAAAGIASELPAMKRYMKIEQM
jgi:hypothetical protein